MPPPVLSGSTASTADILKIERGKALSCLERTLFYADSIPTDINEVYNRYSSNTLVSLAIIRIYSKAEKLLEERRESVTTRYVQALKELTEVRLPDRQIKAIELSAVHGIATLDRLIKQAESKCVKIPLPIRELCDDWQGINNLLRLLMDEITHLSNRVDTLNNSIQNSKSLKQANEAASEASKLARFAIWITFISMIVASILTILTSGKQEYWDAPPNTEPTGAARENDAALYLEMGKLAERVDDIPRASENSTELKAVLAAGKTPSELISEARALDDSIGISQDGRH